MASHANRLHEHTDADTHLLPPLLFALVLGGLQHLLLPQVEEVRRVSVELERILFVVPAMKIMEVEVKKMEAE